MSQGLLEYFVSGQHSVQRGALVVANAPTTAFANAMMDLQGPNATSTWSRTRTIFHSVQMIAVVRDIALPTCASVLLALEGLIVQWSSQWSARMLVQSMAFAKFTMIQAHQNVHVPRVGPVPTVLSKTRFVPLHALVMAAASMISAHVKSVGQVPIALSWSV